MRTCTLNMHAHTQRTATRMRCVGVFPCTYIQLAFCVHLRTFRMYYTLLLMAIWHMLTYLILLHAPPHPSSVRFIWDTTVYRLRPGTTVTSYTRVAISNVHGIWHSCVCFMCICIYFSRNLEPVTLLDLPGTK